MTRIRDRFSRAIAPPCLALTLAPLLLAQTTPQSGHITPPDRVLYFILFDNITKQDQMATQQTAAGQNGAVVKNYYAGVIGLSAADFQILHDTSLSCRASVAQQDQAAAAVIQTYRTAAAAASAAHAPVPSVPAQLTTMQQQRNNTILACAAQLQSSMTPAGFQKMYQYLHQSLASHVQVKPPSALIRKSPQ